MSEIQSQGGGDVTGAYNSDQDGSDGDGDGFEEAEDTDAVDSDSEANIAAPTVTPEAKYTLYKAEATSPNGLICWQQLSGEYAVNLYRDSVALRASLINDVHFVVNGIKALPNLTKAELSIFFDEKNFQNGTPTEMFEKRIKLLNRVNKVERLRRKNETMDDIETHIYGHGWLWLTGFLIGARGKNKVYNVKANQLANVNTPDITNGVEGIKKRTKLKNIVQDSFLDMLNVTDAVALVEEVGPAWFLLGTLLAGLSKPTSRFLPSEYWTKNKETMDLVVKQDITFIDEWMDHVKETEVKKPNTYIALREVSFTGVKERLAELVSSTQKVLVKELNLSEQIEHAKHRVDAFEETKTNFLHVRDQLYILNLQQAANPIIGARTYRTMMWSRLAYLNTVLDHEYGKDVDAEALENALNANALVVQEGEKVIEPDNEGVIKQTGTLNRLMELIAQFRLAINEVRDMQERAYDQMVFKLAKKVELLGHFMVIESSSGGLGQYDEKITREESMLSAYKKVISEGTDKLDGLVSEPNTTVKTEPDEDSMVTYALVNAGSQRRAVGLPGADPSPGNRMPSAPPPQLRRALFLSDNPTGLVNALTIHSPYDTRKRLQQLIDGNNALVDKEALYRKQGPTLSSTHTLTASIDADSASIEADSAETRNNVLAEGEEMAAIRGEGRTSMDRFLINEPFPQKRIIHRFAGAGPIYSADPTLDKILTEKLVFSDSTANKTFSPSTGPMMNYSEQVFYAAICMAAPTILHDFFLSPRVLFSAPGVSHESVLNVQKSMALFLARIGEKTVMKNFVDTIGTGAYFLAETYLTGSRAKLSSIEETFYDISAILTLCNTSALINYNHNRNGLVCLGTENSSAVAEAEAVDFININHSILSITVVPETIIKVQARLPGGLGLETALLEHVRYIWRSNKTNKTIN